MNEIFSPPGEDEEDRGPLMRGLACLPVFFSLAGKRVALAGGSNAVLWKAELCQAAGARLDVFSPDPCSGLVALQGGARRSPSFRGGSNPRIFAAPRSPSSRRKAPPRRGSFRSPRAPPVSRLTS